MLKRTDTNDYEAAHGRKPRGRGSWAFYAVVSNGSGYSNVWSGCKFFAGTYTEAKRAAFREAVEYGEGSFGKGRVFSVTLRVGS